MFQHRLTILAFCGFLLVSSFVGCAAPKSYSNWTRTDIYFGRDISATNSEVTETEFEQFLEKHIAPHVGGMTVYQAKGRYMDDETQKLVSERTFIVSILETREDSQATLLHLEAAAEAYRVEFQQSSVMIEHKPTWVRFVAGE